MARLVALVRVHKSEMVPVLSLSMSWKNASHTRLRPCHDGLVALFSTGRLCNCCYAMSCTWHGLSCEAVERHLLSDFPHDLYGVFCRLYSRWQCCQHGYLGA
jgi:hypothetical protein